MEERRAARREAIDRVRRSARWRENRLRIEDIQILLEGSSSSPPSSSDDDEIDPLSVCEALLETSADSDTELERARRDRLRRAKLLRDDALRPPSRRTPPRVVTPPPRVATPPPPSPPPVRGATPPPPPRVATPPPSPPPVLVATPPPPPKVATPPSPPPVRVATPPPPPRVATPSPPPVRVATPPPPPRVATPPPPSPPMTRSRARLQSSQGEPRRSARLRAMTINRMDPETATKIVEAAEREKVFMRRGKATRTRSGRLSYRPYCFTCGCCK